MKSDLFSIGGFTVHGYGLMIGIGFILALLVAEYRAKKLNMKEEAIIDIAILAGVFGFLGAKVLFVIINFKEFLQEPMSVLGTEGFVVYGGIISGVAAALIYCKIKKLKFLDYFDLVMPEVALAQGFGRIGCLLAGCCYGRETDLWMGITFPEGSLAPAGVKLLPTQIFSSIGDFIIAIVLIIVAHKGKEKFLKSGNIGELYMIMYGIGRFIVEFFRNDYRGEVGFMSTSQFISIFIVIGGIVLYAVNRKKESIKDKKSI